MSDIVTQMELHQKMSRREQILSSIQDTEKALTTKVEEETENYLTNYLQELRSELKQLGLN